MNFYIVNIVNNNPDLNGVGAVPYEYFMAEFPVSNGDYCDFLNNCNTKSIFRFDTLNLEHQGISFEKINGKIKFYPKSGYENKPVVYVSYENVLSYVNWLNNKNDNYHSYKNNSDYWIPCYNEWYKAAYFDGKSGYFNFPLQTNDIEEIVIDINKHSFNSNYILNNMSDNGLFSLNKTYFNIKDMAGNIYEFVRNTENSDLCRIMGGSWNRHFLNSSKNSTRFINKHAYNNYIGMRICKKYPSRLFKIALYNNFGDGWKNDSLSIYDINGGKLLSNIKLISGSGPQFFEFMIFSQTILVIEYNSRNSFFYENSYEIYDEDMNKVYVSRPFKGNRNQQIVVLKNDK